MSTVEEGTRPADAPLSGPAPRTGQVPRGGVAAVLGAGLAAAVVLLLLGGGAPQEVPAGLPDPGALTGWALPVLGVLGNVLAVVVVGAFLVPLLVMLAPADDLRGASWRAVRSTRPLLLVWAVVVVAEAVFSVSDQFAVPVDEVATSTVLAYLVEVDQGRAQLVQVVLLVTAALAVGWVLRTREAAAVLGVVALSLVPPVLTGHSASSGSHDLAVLSLLVHVFATSVWVGGVLALWWHLGADDDARALAARRFAGLAGWCFGVVAASGAANAAVRLGGVEELVTTGYGAGVLAKVAVLVVLGVIAARLRSGYAASSADPAAPPRRLLTRLTALEATVMATALGLGVALSRTPPPVGEPYTSRAEELIGGPLPPEPTVERLLTSTNASGVGLLIVLLGTAAYVVGLRTLRRRGDRWPAWRAAAFFAGLLLTAWVTLGGLGAYSHVMFSAHMAAHMLLSMVVPILLVVGAPVTLALRALPGADVPGARGPRQLLADVLRSRPVAFTTHPAFATLVFVGSLYAVYFTGIFGTLMESHLGHAFMELHFLISGYLFFETLIGSAPIPKRLPHLARLGLMLVVAPFHAFFSVALMSSSTPVGEDYYAALDRPWATDLVEDQYVGGSMSWALGEVPIVMVAIALLVQWFVSDQRAAKRHDRREAAAGADNQHDAYNAMLRRISEADARTGAGTERD